MSKEQSTRQSSANPGTHPDYVKALEKSAPQPQETSFKVSVPALVTIHNCDDGSLRVSIDPIDDCEESAPDVRQLFTSWQRYSSSVPPSGKTPKAYHNLWSSDLNVDAHSLARAWRNAIRCKTVEEAAYWIGIVRIIHAEYASQTHVPALTPIHDKFAYGPLPEPPPQPFTKEHRTPKPVYRVHHGAIDYDADTLRKAWLNAAMCTSVEECEYWMKVVASIHQKYAAQTSLPSIATVMCCGLEPPSPSDTASVSEPTCNKT